MNVVLQSRAQVRRVGAARPPVRIGTGDATVTGAAVGVMALGGAINGGITGALVGLVVGAIRKKIGHDTQARSPAPRSARQPPLLCKGPRNRLLHKLRSSDECRSRAPTSGRRRAQPLLDPQSGE